MVGGFRTTLVSTNRTNEHPSTDYGYLCRGMLGIPFPGAFETIEIIHGIFVLHIKLRQCPGPYPEGLPIRDAILHDWIPE